MSNVNLCTARRNLPFEQFVQEHPLVLSNQTVSRLTLNLCIHIQTSPLQLMAQYYIFDHRWGN
jgi:hypothetical protein